MGGGILTFFAMTMLVGNVFENLGVRTEFPYRRVQKNNCRRSRGQPALPHQFCYLRGGGCLMQNATGMNRAGGTSEEADQVDYTEGASGECQAALSNGGSKWQEADPG
jgi:hypothetical protein